MPESPIQSRLIRIIQDQPADSSRDEILRELAFDRVIQRGLEDVAEGRTHTTDELRKHIRSWRS